jgi:predicted dehydrogenase
MKKNSMKESNLKIGIAGYGYVGKKRRKILDNISGVKIVAISDKNPKYKISSKEIKFFKNYKNLLNENLDVIFVSLPNKYAAEITRLAIKKNIHVFCEKPPARNIKELKKVLNEFQKKKNKIKLKYGFNHRYHDSIILAKKIIDSKKYGRLINLKGLYGKSKITSFAGEWRSKKSMAGGGILLDQGIHMLDLMRYFCGDFLEIKSFVSNDFWKHQIEDNAYIIMRSNKKVVAMIHSTATQWQHQFRIEITLEKALINLTGILSGSMTYGQESIEIQPKLLKNKKKVTIKFKKDLSWRREITEYIHSVKFNKKINNGTIHDSMEIMQMIDTIYKSDIIWKKNFFNS